MIFLIPTFILLLNISPPEGLSMIAWRTLIVAMLMAILWITEFIPLAATALLPLVLFPILDIANIKSAAAPYAHPLIFLFLGGFIIAQAMQKWNLHKRIALNIISIIGTKPSSIIAGFMGASAFLSMWISNTATALMMMPIAISLVQLFKEENVDIKNRSNFSLVLLLSIAYSCSIGGVGTLIGTPPNALMAAFLQENYSITIGFAEWMLVGIPFVIISLPIAFLILTKIIFPIELRTK
jgi:sodium-dependent dicarboxylate transporter 2/3/5